MAVDVRAVIFDLDGTLADTLEDIAASVTHVLDELGQPTYTVEQYRAWVGWGVRHLMEQALADDAKHLADEATARFRAHYGDHLVDRSKPYDGVPELLDALAEDHILAVLSNKPHAMTRVVVSALFPSVGFADVVGKREGVPRKPDPTSALALVGRLGVSVAQCVYVGDTDVDIQTAIAAGMIPVGVGWGFRDGAKLRDSGARWVLSKPSELVEIIRDLQKSE